MTTATHSTIERCGTETRGTSLRRPPIYCPVDYRWVRPGERLQESDLVWTDSTWLPIGPAIVDTVLQDIPGVYIVRPEASTPSDGVRSFDESQEPATRPVTASNEPGERFLTTATEPATTARTEPDYDSSTRCIAARRLLQHLPAILELQQLARCVDPSTGNRNLNVTTDEFEVCVVYKYSHDDSAPPFNAAAAARAIRDGIDLAGRAVHWDNSAGGPATAYIHRVGGHHLSVHLQPRPVPRPPTP